MKKIYRMRLLCLLLTVLMLTGCTPFDQAPTRDPMCLEIKETVPVYSDNFLKISAPRVATLLSQLSRRGGGPIPNESEKQKLCALWQEDILPLAKKALIYENEWEMLLTRCETTVSAFEDKVLEPNEYFTLLSSLYSNAVAILGSSKAGTLAYECMQLYLKERIAVCEARYEKYGYSWYLTDAQRYRRLLKELTEQLNVTLFCEGLAVLFCFTPFIPTLSAANTDKLELPLYDAELLLFLQKQAKRGKELAIDGEKWGILAELLVECMPDGKGNTLLQKEYTVLKDLGYPRQAAHVMPALLELIEAVTAGLSEADLVKLRENTDPIVLCATISHAETAFFAFTDALEQHAKTNDNAERIILEKAGLSEAYLTFSDVTPSRTAAELFSAITTCTDTVTVEKAEWFDACFLGYCRSLAPYLTYIMKAG